MKKLTLILLVSFMTLTVGLANPSPELVRGEQSETIVEKGMSVELESFFQGITVFETLLLLTVAILLYMVSRFLDSGLKQFKGFVVFTSLIFSILFLLYTALLPETTIEYSNTFLLLSAGIGFTFFMKLSEVSKNRKAYQKQKIAENQSQDSDYKPEEDLVLQKFFVTESVYSLKIGVMTFVALISLLTILIPKFEPLHAFFASVIGFGVLFVSFRRLFNSIEENDFGNADLRSVVLIQSVWFTVLFLTITYLASTWLPQFGFLYFSTPHVVPPIAP